GLAMQGTIKQFDAADRTGSVVTDDRAEVSIEAASFPDDTILPLRLGQGVFCSPWPRHPFPAVNDGKSRAGTTIGMSGLRGFRAIRSLRCLRSKVPKSASVTRSPFTTASRTASIDASTTRATSAFERPVRLEGADTQPP